MELFASCTVVAAINHKLASTKLWLSVSVVALACTLTLKHMYPYTILRPCCCQQALQHIVSLLIRINDNCSQGKQRKLPRKQLDTLKNNFDRVKELFKDVNGFCLDRVLIHELAYACTHTRVRCNNRLLITLAVWITGSEGGANNKSCAFSGGGGGVDFRLYLKVFLL